MVTRDDGFHDAFSFHECGTTNQRMELCAVIAGLAALPPATDILVKSDSKYVVDGYNQNWKTKTNHDLWDELKDLMKHRTAELVWIPRCSEAAHAEADKLAKQASRRCN